MVRGPPPNPERFEGGGVFDPSESRAEKESVCLNHDQASENQRHRKGGFCISESGWEGIRVPHHCGNSHPDVMIRPLREYLDLTEFDQVKRLCGRENGKERGKPGISRAPLR